MTEFDAELAARTLNAMREKRTRIERMEPAPCTAAEGAAVQRARARLLDADPPAGFKIGATGRRMQEYLGLSGPAAGFMTAAGVHSNGATLRFADLTSPGVECEVAVRLARDLPPSPCSAEQAADAVGELMAGIEVVENRYGDLAALGTPTLIADQVFHTAAVVGEGTTDWRLLDLPRLSGRITLNDETVGEGVASDLLGNPMNALAWLAASEVAAAFGGLRRGQVVMLGSVTPPIWLNGPGQISVSFAPLPPVHLTLF